MRIDRQMGFTIKIRDGEVVSLSVNHQVIRTNAASAVEVISTVEQSPPEASQSRVNACLQEVVAEFAGSMPQGSFLCLKYRDREIVGDAPLFRNVVTWISALLEIDAPEGSFAVGWASPDVRGAACYFRSLVSHISDIRKAPSVRLPHGIYDILLDQSLSALLTHELGHAGMHGLVHLKDGFDLVDDPTSRDAWFGFVIDDAGHPAACRSLARNFETDTCSSRVAGIGEPATPRLCHTVLSGPTSMVHGHPLRACYSGSGEVHNGAITIRPGIVLTADNRKTDVKEIRIPLDELHFDLTGCATTFGFPCAMEGDGDDLPVSACSPQVLLRGVSL